MKRRHDKHDVARALVEIAVDAWPDAVPRSELERQPAIAAADGRTVFGAIRHLCCAGVIAIVDQDAPSGRVMRIRAAAPAAMAVRALR